MAILTLAKRNHVQYVVSQNIDGLHLKSGLERAKLSELHGMGKSAIARLKVLMAAKKIKFANK